MIQDPRTTHTQNNKLWNKLPNSMSPHTDVKDTGLREWISHDSISDLCPVCCQVDMFIN